MKCAKTFANHSMKFQVTSLTLDFEDDDFECPPALQSEIYDDIIGSFWDAADKDDLIEEITTVAGFAVKDIDYRHILI